MSVFAVNDQSALEMFDKVLALAPNDTDTWVNKGYVLWNLNRTDEANKAFDKVIEIHPEMKETIAVLRAVLTGSPP